MIKRKAIAVNTRFLIKNKLEGIGLFTYESLKRITQAHPEIDFYFLFDRKFDDEFIFSKNVKPVVLFPPARHPFLWFWWFEIAVASWLNKNKSDLFLSTDGYGCLRTDVPQILVVHDLAFEHFKEHVPFLTRKYYQYFMPRYTQKAKRIATVSEFSKSDIVKQYHISPEKIDVVYNGAKEVYKPLSEVAKERVKAKYSGSKPYFIFVGSIHPRKNVRNLLLGFEQFIAQTNSDFQLLIVGRKAWDFSEVEEVHSSMRFKNEVKFLGHVSPAELGKIVASAFAAVYASLFEGFGIPIVEAMNCDVPVITSNVTSMPEVAGNAALLVNPNSVNEISSAMKTIVEDSSLRNSLIQKGRIQIKKFSWDLTADELWKCCSQVLENA
ncbi:MAG: glycosyltransferase family 1 protein [Bacteroidota bacterium]